MPSLRTFREALLVAIVFFGPAAFGCTEPWSKSALYAGAFVLFILAIADPAPLPPNRAAAALTVALSGLAGLALLQLLGAGGPLGPAGLLPETLSSSATWTRLVGLAAQAALLWGAARVLADEGAWSRLPWVLFIVAAFVAVVGLVQRAHGDAHFYGLRPIGAYLRPFGPYGNHDHAASLIAMGACSALGAVAGRLASQWTRTRSPAAIAEHFVAILPAILLVLTLLLALWKAGSKGAIASLGAALWLSAASAARWEPRPRRRLWVWGGLVCAALFMLLAGRWAYPRLDAWFGGSAHMSIEYRLSMLRSGVAIWKDFPLFGCGLGTLEFIHPAYQEPRIVERVDHLHNDWVELLAEGGALGLVALLAGLGWAAAAIDGCWRRAEPARIGLVHGGVASALLFCVHSAFDFPHHVPANAAWFTVLVAWLGRDPRRPDQGRPLAARVRFVLVAAATAGMALGIRPAVGDWHALGARRAPPEERGARYARALSWDPSIRNWFNSGACHLESGSGPLSPSRLRAAVEATTAGLRMNPLSRDLRALAAAALWRLDRKSDARGMTGAR